MRDIKRNFILRRIALLAAIFVCALPGINGQKRPNGVSPACVPAPIGLVSWWSFDETSGTAALDRRTRNHGTANGTTTLGAAGKVGTAFAFDGADDGVVAADNATLDFGSNQDFSIDAWIKPSPTGGSIMTILDKRDTAGPIFGYALSLVNGNLVLQLADGGFTNFGVGGADLRDGQWHHVAVTVDRDFDLVFYVDGAPIGNLSPVTRNGDLSNAAPFRIGAHADTPGFYFDGAIDELQVFGRALSAAEVAAIAGAGVAGQCRPTAVAAPANVFAWIAGDGNAADISGNGNNGTLLGNTNYAVGKVGQSLNFSAGASDVVTLGQLPGFNYAGSLTVEAWIRPTTVSGFTAIVTKWGQNFTFCGAGTTADSFAIYLNNGQLFGAIHQTSGAEPSLQGGSIAAGQYSHVAMTFNPTAGALAIYVNGTAVASNTVGTTGLCNSNKNVFIGGEDSGSPRRFNGQIDEATIYSRALSAAEIQSIFNAGLGGKLKTATVPTGFAAAGGKSAWAETPDFSPAAVNVTVGNAAITFQAVTTAGIVQSVPIDTSALPAPPAGQTQTGLAFDIATTAVYSGEVLVCFNLPAFAALSPTEFYERRILHLESGVWVNRTHFYDLANRTLCSRSPSLSPFAIVDSNLTPTAANVAVAGRVSDANGRGIPNAAVDLTDSLGSVRTTRTNSFGFYRFENVSTGQTVVVAVRSKANRFDPRIVTVTEDLADVDFAP
ncbi:MAG: carboxypeptidase regulatory-like domain-containing protein [Acidobacteria bacterium]|nr:carboxypeptidase regulatory-like domain-containing protein [Acidobacteriota bacterium]